MAECAARPIDGWPALMTAERNAELVRRLLTETPHETLQRQAADAIQQLTAQVGALRMALAECDRGQS